MDSPFMAAGPRPGASQEEHWQHPRPAHQLPMRPLLLLLGSACSNEPRPHPALASGTGADGYPESQPVVGGLFHPQSVSVHSPRDTSPGSRRLLSPALPPPHRQPLPKRHRHPFNVALAAPSPLGEVDVGTAHQAHQRLHQRAARQRNGEGALGRNGGSRGRCHEVSQAGGCNESQVKPSETTRKKSWVGDGGQELGPGQPGCCAGFHGVYS